eukprot:1624582-Amphidinium_carterae.1
MTDLEDEMLTESEVRCLWTSTPRIRVVSLQGRWKKPVRNNSLDSSAFSCVKSHHSWICYLEARREATRSLLGEDSQGRL